MITSQNGELKKAEFSATYTEKSLNVHTVCLYTEITAYSIPSLEKADACRLQLVSATASELHRNVLLRKQTQSRPRDQRDEKDGVQDLHFQGAKGT